ncbi:MAG: ABC transporter ATP-binding protein [Ignavibacteria bacterium]|nr:ABC transporter ATP-binding protein [Ignavibacteria bacterium]
MNIIQTQNLTKKFGSASAVQGLSLTVAEGEIYGFLGLNGAGKTTTIRMLLGMIAPTSGSITLFGKDLTRKSDIWNDVGYMVETPHAYPDLSVWENLEIIARLRGIFSKNVVNEVIERLHLTQYRDKQVKHLSLGNVQRLGLAKALMHKPKLLLLDEPINGLDPAGIQEVREMLQELTRSGTTVFLSSHILSEMAKLATRIGIIHAGRLLKQVFTRDLSDLLERELLIRTGDNQATMKLLQERGFEVVLNGENCLHTKDQRALQHPEDIATLCVAANLPPQYLSVVEEDLEHYFLRTIHQN